MPDTAYGIWNTRSVVGCSFSYYATAASARVTEITPSWPR